MGRPREFNAEQALDQAMEVFWAKGYEATSLQDLIGAMELSKSSFYEAFGSKRELFLSAIGHYIDTRTESVVKLLDEEDSGKTAIEKLFRIILESVTGAGEVRGCFLCNCAVEISQRDPEAAVYVARGIDRIEEAFYRAVVRGQESGEISAGRDPRALARFLVSSENGLIVMAKANRGGEAMADIARTVLSALD